MPYTIDISNLTVIREIDSAEHNEVMRCRSNPTINAVRRAKCSQKLDEPEPSDEAVRCRSTAR